MDESGQGPSLTSGTTPQCDRPASQCRKGSVVLNGLPCPQSVFPADAALCDLTPLPHIPQVLAHLCGVAVGSLQSDEHLAVKSTT